MITTLKLSATSLKQLTSNVALPVSLSTFAVVLPSPLDFGLNSDASTSEPFIGFFLESYKLNVIFCLLTFLSKIIFLSFKSSFFENITFSERIPSSN